MKAMVVGAGGMLGSDLTDALVGRDHEVLALTRQDLDITDGPAVDDIVAAERPDAVLNCAAFTDVDGAEEREADAMSVNDTAAGLLSVAAGTVGAKILYVSSDYVFDGTKASPYVESDIPHALSAYGRSKQGGETSTSVPNPRHFVVRSSWLFGARGGNFIETMLRLAGERPEVVVVADQVGSPTYTRHLAEALAMLVETEDYGIHHVAASGKCSWFEFAQEIFDQSETECRVMSGTTAMLGRPAPRPAWSVLASERADAFVLPEWRAGLTAYLSERTGTSEAAPGREAGDIAR